MGDSRIEMQRQDDFDVYRPADAVEPLPAVILVHGPARPGRRPREFYGPHGALLAGRGLAAAVVGVRYQRLDDWPADTAWPPHADWTSTAQWLAAVVQRVRGEPGIGLLAGVVPGGDDRDRDHSRTCRQLTVLHHVRQQPGPLRRAVTARRRDRARTGTGPGRERTIPSAPAAITNFAVAPGNSPIFSEGNTYTALATANPGEYISFYDSQDGEFDPPGAIQIGSERTIGIEVHEADPTYFPMYTANIR
ncbi:hypothetical protein AWN90_32405 [Nocardia terpenica]|uniref:Alpha/beta hydrolase n=1 Tax=Nocardia terpenica TaxID=455432 RepID=A0A164MH84_9NOCA|nr:hypothetical protein AWN90_32405 [Nocardia terpenica]